MAEVKRYVLTVEWNFPKIVEHKEGRYVLYTDYAALLEEVREWLCEACNYVYPGPPQKGLSCVICPRCGGSTGPRMTMNVRALEKRVGELESAIKALVDETPELWGDNVEDGVLRHYYREDTIHGIQQALHRTPPRDAHGEGRG